EDLNGGVTVNDFGCGYGALFDLMVAEPMMHGGRYTGYDITPEMVDTAQERHDDTRASFVVSPVATERAAYSFASGTYNMSMGANHALWTHYVKTSLKMLWDKTDKILGFNLLDNATPEKLDDLYYADKRDMIAYALSLSPEVEIIDDYPLNEFTIFVKRPEK
ncbi:class I SAM-dependent methyltransferase, partial [Pseudomonadota bacterium]